MLSARALYGAELRHYRERKGLTLRELADMLHIEVSFLARIEQGERRLPDELAGPLDRLLDTGGFFERNLAAARSAPRPSSRTPLAEWERLAVAIREWDAALILGLLQTDAYARAVADTYRHVLADRVQRHRWEARLSRTPVLLDPTGPRYTAVLGETVLRRPLGGPAAMAVQLDHLAALVRCERVTLTVLPFAATPHPTAMDGALCVTTFADETPAVHFTSHYTGAHGTEPGTTSLAHLAYDLLLVAALPPDSAVGAGASGDFVGEIGAMLQRVSPAGLEAEFVPYIDGERAWFRWSDERFDRCVSHRSRFLLAHSCSRRRRT